MNTVTPKRKETCREEILNTAKSIVKEKQLNEFSIGEVLSYMKKNDTTFSSSTISTHISSRCCINSPNHHAVTYSDFERIRAGVYRLLNI
ncbi:DUF7669 domain-containing protein [Peribacillus deserti]|uniref:DUF7669 domain-containing protein n=1 Tax=Peribacillus deserti TaxID=673318 RepID=A0A2N5MBN8_9BACI|nr:hypothetical protein [Peribacillus deserti]PLT31764.1 hypothetical protein CUU66_00970 [Peribacillus deserti]